jgi:prophage tail gpP-like protein
MQRVARLCLVLAPAFWPVVAWSWEEQRVLEYIAAHNPVVRAQRTVTEEFALPNGWIDRAKEYTSLYARAGGGGNDYQTSGAVLQAGVQISIPLASTKERRERAQKLVEETRAMQELRTKALGDIGTLRQQEADLTAAETKLKFYADKSAWLQQRVKDGFSDAEQLWDIGQKLNDERAAVERLRTLVSSQRYQLASAAGDHWQDLLRYLEGKAALR